MHAHATDISVMDLPSDASTPPACGDPQPGPATREEPLRQLSLPILLALLAAGALLAWLLHRHGGPVGLSGWMQLGLFACAAAIAAVPPISRAAAKLPDWLRHPSPRARAWTAASVWAIALVYLIVTARQQDRQLYPRIHDECSYTTQTRMLSEGHLWQPQHELADFFETFYVLTRPVYSSIYFPGTALMNAPGIWLRQPSWVVPVLLAALVVAFTYRVSAELIDGTAGLLVALLLLATRLFRTYSTMVMAEVPVMLLGLLMIWAWLRWRAGRKWYWGVAIGVFAGWAAITRPVDALAFAIPIGLSMASDLCRAPRRLIVPTTIALFTGAMPYLALQATFDWRVTGNPWKTPYGLYLEHDQPGSAFGSGVSGMVRAESKLPQKRIGWADLAAGAKSSRQDGILAWAGLRLLFTGSIVFPCAMLLLLLPAGLLIAPERGRWVVLAAMPLCLLLYAPNPLFLRHYALPYTTAIAMCVVLGARTLERAASTKYRRAVGTFLTTALILLAVGSLPQLDSRVVDEVYRTPLLDYTQRALAQIPSPAVVLFRFTPGGNVYEEPVYNTDVTWPDDAPIIRAHDLGPRDGELLRYYALRQPERTFWLFDRRSGNVFELGNAAQAATALHVSLGPPPDLTADVR